MAFEKVATVKVAKVISEHEVAFNMGGNAGIRKDDVVVLSDRVEIKDPDSGSDLGAVLVPRLRFAVTLVSEKYCLGKVTDRVGASGGSATTWSSLSAPLKRISDDPWAEGSDIALVKIGEQAEVRRTVRAQEDEPPF